MAKKKKFDLLKAIGIAVFLAVGILSYLYSNGYILTGNHPSADTYIDFIECGQGDSTLIVSDDCATLVDATTGKDAQKVVEHLKERNIKRIDHFILTHPHEDHIGGAEDILDSFDVGTIYMRRPTKGTEPTTKVYLNLLKKIKSLGKTVHTVEAGDLFESGEWTFEVFGPLKDYEDLNDQSVVLKGTYQGVSVLLTGDMESGVEKDLCEAYGADLNSTILKVGHHGSRTSSSAAFLKAVSPQYGVISCEAGNSYGHPHKEALNRLKKYNVVTFRTDRDGTVTLITDGRAVWKGAES